MDAFVVGNLGGRLALSYLVVWMSMLVFTRDWRIASRRAHSVYGLGCVLLLFCAGLATLSWQR